MNFHPCRRIHGAESTTAPIRLSLIAVIRASAGPSTSMRRGSSLASRTLISGAHSHSMSGFLKMNTTTESGIGAASAHRTRRRSSSRWSPKLIVNRDGSSLVGIGWSWANESRVSCPLSSHRPGPAHAEYKNRPGFRTGYIPQLV